MIQEARFIRYGFPRLIAWCDGGSLILEIKLVEYFVWRSTDEGSSISRFRLKETQHQARHLGESCMMNLDCVPIEE